MFTTVYIAVAEFPLLSVALIVCGPTANSFGIEIIAEKEPPQFVSTVKGMVGWIAPSYVIVMVLSEANPVPVIVVVANPCVGDNVIEGTQSVVQAEAMVTTVKASVKATIRVNTFFILSILLSSS
jgi:1,4-dihydroxy-2-naphthoate octaprenyltransferase